MKKEIGEISTPFKIIHVWKRDNSSYFPFKNKIEWHDEVRDSLVRYAPISLAVDLRVKLTLII